MAWRVPMCAVLLLSVTGCAGYAANLRQVDAALAARDPAAALVALKPLAGGRSHALYLLDKAMVLRMAGEYAGSVDAFEAAKHRMRFLEATSVTETAAALTVTENLRSYQGALHERLLLYVYQSLNYLQLGRVEAARVEARQIDRLLQRLYPKTGAAPDGVDAFARYFAALMYEGAGQRDEAMIAYRKAYQAYRRAGLSDNAIPLDLRIRLCRLADYLGFDRELRDYRQRFGIDGWPPVASSGSPASGQLVFLFSNGLAPRKIAVTEFIAHDGRIFNISLPALRRRAPPVHGAKVSVAGESVVTDRVASIARSASVTLAEEMPGLVMAEIARNVARAAIADEAEEQQSGLGLLVSFVGAVVDRADTRTWHTLPDSIQMARLRLPPGRYDVAVSLQGRHGGRVGSRTFEDVEVDPGRITFAAWHHVSYRPSQEGSP